MYPAWAVTTAWSILACGESVPAGKRGRIAVATEVGGGDRVELERREEVPLAQRDEFAVLGRHGGVGAAGGEGTQGAEGGEAASGAMDERTAIHVGSG